jgi:aryl-alcohol dehydrogenase-like predicted oxidoreductase
MPSSSVAHGSNLIATRRPGVIGPIVGARTVEHLRNNLGAAELTLDNGSTARS